MAGHAGTAIPDGAAGGGAGRRWPSLPAAYWALTVIVLATFLNFLMYRAIRPYREEIERLEALENAAR